MGKVTLGDEHDAALIQTINHVLKQLGAKRKRAWWGMAGSQDISRSEWRIGWHTVVLEVETYVGVSLSGSGSLIRRIAGLVKKARSTD